MIGINIVRNLKILYFSKKNKENKKLKKLRKKVDQHRHLYASTATTIIRHIQDLFRHIRNLCNPGIFRT